jgi:hypothetical protein
MHRLGLAAAVASLVLLSTATVGSAQEASTTDVVVSRVQQCGIALQSAASNRDATGLEECLAGPVASGFCWKKEEA